MNTSTKKTAQTCQRKIIDLTRAVDDEVILILACDIVSIACDIDNAIVVLKDIGTLLALIYYKKINADTAIAMARLAHEATETWSSLLYSQLENINDTLAMTAYSKVGSHD